MHIEKLYYWELEYTDGTKWDRRRNVYYKNRPQHINPQDPLKQVYQIKFIPVRKNLPELKCNIPPNFKPICFWRNIVRMNGVVENIQIFIGCQNAKRKFYKIYDINSGEETYVREDL